MPVAWPPVLACPELKRLDLQGRGADRQPEGLSFMERAQGKCESCKESEGGRGARELGTEARWVGQKKRRGRTG